MVIEYTAKEFALQGDFSQKERVCFGTKWILLFSAGRLFRIASSEERSGAFPENCETGPSDICLVGTEFQRTVWKALLALSWGEKVSYSELARRAGYPKAIRAVASAVADNPLPLLVPCHRVVRASGEIGQFRYGTPLKRELLLFEELLEGGLDKRLIVF